MREFVFISYNHRDTRPVREFAARLDAAGIDYFRDTSERNYGADLSVTVRSAIEGATYVVAFVSKPEGRSRDWVAFELGIAYEMKKRIVVRLLGEDVDLPGYLANLRYMRDEADEEEFVTQLVEQPLFEAVDARDLERIKSLVGLGASLESRDEVGNTPLLRAVFTGDEPIVEFLLDAGADVDAGNRDHWAPLHVAATVGHLGIAKLLVGRGADVNSDRHVTGMMPLDMAAMRGHRELVAFLRENGGRSRWEPGGKAVDMSALMPPENP